MNFQKPSQQVSVHSQAATYCYMQLTRAQEMVQVGSYPARMATAINSR